VTRLPRILPLVGIAVGGVLAINALAGATDLPNLVAGARAWAEQAAKPEKPDKKAGPGKAAKAGDKAVGDKSAAGAADPNAPGPLPGVAGAATGEAADAAAQGLPPPSIAPKPVCAPTAAELAKEAGLSPAELQVLQNLGARRGQLDEREQQLSTQLALLQAAEAKVDAKMRALNGLRDDVSKLLAQADGREAAEVDRLVKVFEGMKPKDAAARMAILDDSVRLPIAAKMKERSLSAVIGQMPPAEAKKLTESLAHRFAAAQTLAQSADAKAAAAAAAAPAAPPPQAQATDANAPAEKAQPAKPKRQARKAPRKAAPADQQADAAASPPPAKPAPATPAPAPAKTASAAPSAPPPVAPAPAAPAKAG
jgi:flagellar motility protein MotE (MotC chaperone)